MHSHAANEATTTRHWGIMLFNVKKSYELPQAKQCIYMSLHATSKPPDYLKSDFLGMNRLETET